MSVAQTALGALQGISADGVVRFRGVTYATAARFHRPEPVAAWAGVRDATAHGPIPPQPSSRLRTAMGDYARPQAEDCLTLTIATPAADAGARPVIVFLHGGAYLSGAGSLDWYDGGALARAGDCVVVGVNYRLGALGWMHLPGVADGNAGLWDMLAALAFVRDHIAAFGGDPRSVTLVGQSAGAHAIMCLLTMDESEGLFHRAILQSAPASLAPYSSAKAAEYANFVADSLAADPREVSVARLLEGQMQLARGLAGFADITPPFLPVMDGLAEPGEFMAAAARGAAARAIPVIIGTTREEMHAFFAPDPSMRSPDPKALAARFRALAGHEDAIELYRRRRPGGTVADLLGDLVTDHLFLFPSLVLAQAIGDAGGVAYAYQFNWAAPGNMFQACHCIELPFVFATLDAWPGAGMLEGGAPAEMADLAEVIERAWAAFARTGDPDVPGLPWVPYAQARATMIFDRVLGMAGDPAGAVWRGVFEE
jgi:para-nitrobenzyl esterase